MRTVVALLTSLIATLALAASVGARPATPGEHALAGVNLPWKGLWVGVNDDAGYSRPDWLYPAMHGDGLRVDTLTLRWDSRRPFTIPARDAVKNAVDHARASGVAIELDLYPLRARAFTGGKHCRPSLDPAACGNGKLIRLFAGWTAQVADAFPSVHQFVVMNECNQPLFLNPQWDASGQNQSAAICGRALAAAYDALKAADRANVVWGLGLSPRGNDNPRAATNSSTSPVRFIAHLGAWFRAFAAKTHRTAPLMDGLDFHPYPVPQSLPFATGYPAAKDASIANLPRLYQAFYDAFAGTPQRTIGQQRGGGLPVSLNEAGIQTAVRGDEYDGWEVSATPAGGVLGRWATQAYQARWYVGMLTVAACDPNVRVVNFFHMVDESDLTGWQSGLYFADQSPKRSAVAVRAWIASTGAACRGKPRPWEPGSPGIALSLDLSKLRLPAPPKVVAVRAADVARAPVAVPVEPLPAAPPAATVPPPPPPAAATPDAPDDTPPADTAPTDDPPTDGSSPPPDDPPPPDG